MRRQEEVIEPELAIVDTHHHLFDKAKGRYLFPDFLTDLATVPNVKATVMVQSSGSMYRAEGDPNFAPVGEVEFVNGVAAMSASGQYGPARVCAGIVGYADLMLGARVKPVLEALVRAGGGRFRGIRYTLAWDADPLLKGEGADSRRHAMESAAFREGFACLGQLGLSFDAWAYQTQADDLAKLIADFPDVPIVLNHLGGPLHIGPYAGRRDEVFAHWRAGVRKLAQYPNVTIKLGGIGMNYGGFGFHELPDPPSSQTLCEAWRPYIETCIEAFGVKRCMCESNFPVDKGVANYVVVWNALKRMASGASADEKQELFSRAGARFYRLSI